MNDCIIAEKVYSLKFFDNVVKANIIFAMNIRDELYDRRIGLSDANNFFVSCERRANSKLKGVPVVVLSNNDGCVVSRSNEAKALGIKMGQPFFQIKQFVEHYGVAVCSGNMALYKKISAEIREVYKRFCPDIEVYSIDECFFNMALLAEKDAVAYAQKIRSSVLNECDIPVSIGIAPTKTLAKLASEYAKKHKECNGVFFFAAVHYNDKDFMSKFGVEDIWGIGRKSFDDLTFRGIKTAKDLQEADELFIKKRYGTPLLCTAKELKGFLCYPLVPKRPKQKQICVSRSFGARVTTREDLQNALICFAVAAAKTLRATKQKARSLTFYAATNRFNADYCSLAEEVIIKNGTSSDKEILASLDSVMDKLFREGLAYKKAGVVLNNLIDCEDGVQLSLFDEENEGRQKEDRAMEAIDKLNSELGHIVVKPAALFDNSVTWKSRADFKSKENKETTKTEQLRFQSNAEDY